jgi:hypothetical protein
MIRIVMTRAPMPAMIPAVILFSSKALSYEVMKERMVAVMELIFDALKVLSRMGIM